MKTFEKETFGESFIKVKLLGKASSKAQSAMEYLMTYGWAILIIAVVLGALFELGVFNPMTFAPKAPPGSCQVFRPNGPGTTSFINLEGVCSGELPQYVASFDAYQDLTVGSLTVSPTGITVTAWVKPNIGSYGEVIRACSSEFGLDFDNGPTTIRFFVNAQYGEASNGYPNNGNWEFIAGTYNGSYAAQWLNGLMLGEEPYNGILSTSTGYSYIGGSTQCAQEAFVGDISNIQVYNASLSANDIQALYLEGIGGAPINLQRLVGWWPLNGNANDYSGNDNNGVPTNVIFVSNWYSGYTPP